LQLQRAPEARPRNEGRVAVDWKSIAYPAEREHDRFSRGSRGGLEDCLTVLDFPEGHGRRLGSTNMLDRLLKTLKQRRRVVGVFPNRAWCGQPVGAILPERHEKRQLETRPCFSMENADLEELGPAASKTAKETA
jgi:transposase-like protein